MRYRFHRAARIFLYTWALLALLDSLP